MQEIFDLGQVAGHGFELIGVDRLVSRGEPAIDLAKHPGRGDANGVRLRECCLGVAHASVELREVDLLHLFCPAAGQLVIQMLPRGAEGLPCPLGLVAQPIAMRTGRVGE